MSSGKSKFYSLPEIHQRALHELYLNRTDPNFAVSQEIINFLEQNQQILREEFNSEFERLPFQQLDTFSTFTDSSGVEFTCINKIPTTPPPSDSSESEGEDSNSFVVKISTSKGSNSNSSSSTDFDDGDVNYHQIRSNVTTLHKSSKDLSPRRTNPLDSMSNLPNDDDNQNSGDKEDGEVLYDDGGVSI